MIDTRSYEKEHIDGLKAKHPTLDQSLIERCVFAFGLLEALVNVGLPFVFKGGTSLLLLLKTPYRLSTDIDIVVKPEICTIQSYLDKVAKIFPFTRMEKQVRKGKSGIPKEHFKFFFQSPCSRKEIHILLDVLYENHGYAKVIGREVRNELLLTDKDPIIVQIPTIESILGDKMTAFAPHTTGIEFEYIDSRGMKNEKTLEVVKQFVDVSKLIEESIDFSDVVTSYDNIVRNEIAYRGIAVSKTDVLMDSFNMALAIVTKGELFPNEYQYLLKGIKKIQNHVYGFRLNGETAYLYAAPIMLLCAKLLTGTSSIEIISQDIFSDKKYRSINKLKKLNEPTFNTVAIALRMIQVL